MDWERAILLREGDVREFIEAVVDYFISEMEDEVEDLEEDFRRFFNDQFIDELAENNYAHCAVVLHGKTFYICYDGEEFLTAAERIGVNWRRILRQMIRRR